MHRELVFLSGWLQEGWLRADLSGCKERCLCWPVDKEVPQMRTKFAVMKLGMTIAALVALAVETGAAQKFA